MCGFEIQPRRNDYDNGVYKLEGISDIPTARRNVISTVRFIVS